MLTVYLVVCALPVAAGLLLYLCGNASVGFFLIAGGYVLWVLGVWRMWRR